MRTRLALALLCLLLPACSTRFRGTEYNVIRYRASVWIWIDRADGSYEQWMLTPTRGPYYQHYVNGRPTN